MMLLAEMMLCLILGSSFVFLPEDSTRFRESQYVKQTYLQVCALAIWSNSDLLKIMSFGMIYLNGSSLRNGGFTHL